MSIIWGSWQNTSSNGMRIGYRVSRTSVSSSSSSVTFTVRIYTQNRYPFADDQYIDFGSYLGSRHSFRNSSSGGAVLRTTRTYRYSYSDYGRSRTLTSSARVGGVWSGLTPSVTIRLAVPARPYRTPLAPTGLSLGSQNSSGAVTLSWTNRRNNSTGRPYTSQRIEYSYYSSSGSWTGWRFLATVSASATSYRYTNMYSNSRYQFRIRANNSAGSSGWSGTVATNTVPAAPTNARAAVESTGNSIRVTWTRNNRRGDGVIFHQIQRQTSSSGSWSTVAARLSSSTSSWVDTNPNAGYNRYRVRSFLDNEYLTQYSSFSTAPSITTIVPPLAPTSLSISPRIPDFTRETTLSWSHRHGGDGADQSYYQIAWRVGSDGAWTYSDEIAGDASTHTFEPDEIPNGERIEVRVRTRGNLQEGFGPYSSSLQVEGWTTPTVSIDETAPGDLVTNIPFEVAWTYNQDEDRAQLRAEVEIWTVDDQGDNVEGDGLVARVLRRTVEGPETSLMVETILDDGGSYAVRVRVTSSREQSSTWASQTFYVDMLPPARADLRPQYDPETGVMVLEVEPHDPRYGVEVDRNVVIDPLPVSTGSWYATRGTATALDGGGIRLTATAGGGQVRLDYVSDIRPAVTAGQYVAIAADIRSPDGENGYLMAMGYDGSTYTNFAPTTARINSEDWERVATVFQVPADVNNLNIRVRFAESPVELGQRLDFRNFAVVQASTDAAALEAVSVPFAGSLAPTSSHAFRWAGAPHASPSIRYALIDEAVEGAEPFEASIDNLAVQRRVNDGEWVTIIDDVDALYVYEEEDDEGANIISLMDLLPAINGRNEYRLHLRSVAPSVADTDPVRVEVTPADNEGWTFLNYGPDMGSVLRVGNNVEVGESMELEGADVPIAGRRRPLSLFGEHETRTLSISGQLYHDELHTAPSSQSPLDSPPDDWRQAQREANTVCLRTPAGHRIYGRMTGLDLTTSNLNVTRLSFSVVENDFREEESTGAGVEVGH